MTFSLIRRITIPNPFLAAALLVLGCGAPPGAPPPRVDAGPSEVPSFSDAGPGSIPSSETCDDGLDGDADGAIDEGCPCTTGDVQSCFAGPATARDVGICASGSQRCEGTDEFGAWGPCEGAVGPAVEVCDNGIDEDCDGADRACGMPDGDGGVPLATDAGPGGGGDGGPTGGLDGGAPPDPIMVPIMFFGDCVTASCPPEAPYPVGCSVFFSPGDDRGCVASQPTMSSVYFQAGDQCNAGFVSGHLLCSTVPGAPLDSTNCPINKPVQIHVSDRSMCPETH